MQNLSLIPNNTFIIPSNKNNASDNEKFSLPLERQLYEIVLEAIFMAVMMLISMIANAIICAYLLLHSSSHCSIANYFIFNLALVDCMTAVLCMPFVLASIIRGEWIFGDVFCGISGFLITILRIASILTLALVAFDRWVAIKEPLKYTSILTPNRLIYLLTYVWIHAALCATLPVLGWGQYSYMKHEFICRPQFHNPQSDDGYTMFLFVTCFAVPFVVISYTYVSILCTARKQIRKIRTRQVQVQPVSTENTLRVEPVLPSVFTQDEITSNNTTYSGRFHIRITKRHHAARGFKMLFIIVIIFLLSWSPYFITRFFSSVSHHNFPPIIKTITTWLTFLNAVCNPFLYGFMNGSLKKAFNGPQKLFSSCFSTPQDVNPLN